jgi:hypothetical protein
LAATNPDRVEIRNEDKRVCRGPRTRRTTFRHMLRKQIAAILRVRSPTLSPEAAREMALVLVSLGVVNLHFGFAPHPYALGGDSRSRVHHWT